MKLSITVSTLKYPAAKMMKTGIFFDEDKLVLFQNVTLKFKVITLPENDGTEHIIIDNKVTASYRKNKNTKKPH
jgi:hypothetical protein